MSAQSPCPEPSRLKQLLDNALPESDQAELNTHLETCETCRNTLDRLAAGSESWSDAAKQLVAGDQPAELDPALKNVVEQLEREVDTNPKRQRGNSSAPGGPVSGGPETGDAISLDFLDAPAKPGHIGRLEYYEIVEVIGYGGMGIVLKAFDPKLNRFVAIKVLAPQLATTAAARKRFEREAKAAAAVRNEHVINIHAVDEWHGLPYLVMEYISGVSLQQRIDERGPAKVEEVLRIGMQAATGLAAAHAQGLVHRDIKPANILLENGVERVKLTDFGLARAVDDASLTQSGVVAGTPQYMAPEQARGESLDPRADLFSLGSVLYFMCTGRPPFRASETMAVLKRVSEDTPRPIREVNPDIPDWLCAIIEKLHAKDAANRFQSATETSEILARHLAQSQHPTLAPAPTLTRTGSEEQAMHYVNRDESSSPQSSEPVAIPAAGSPTRPRRTDDADRQVLESARQAVRTPAAAWLLVAIATVLISLSLAAWSGVTLARIAASPASPEQTTSGSGGVNTTLTRNPHPWRAHRDPLILLLIVQVAAVGVGAQLILAAFCLRRLESPGLVHAGTVFSVIPFSPAWLIGLPIGTWIISVLRRPDVKAAFEQPTPREGEPDDAGFGLNDWLKQPAGCGMVVGLLGLIVSFLPWTHVSVFGVSTHMLGVESWHGLTTAPVCLVAILGLIALELFASPRGWKSAVMLLAGFVAAAVSGSVLVDTVRGIRVNETSRSYSGEDIFRGPLDDLMKEVIRQAERGINVSGHLGVYSMPMLGVVLMLLGLLQLRRPKTQDAPVPADVAAEPSAAVTGEARIAAIQQLTGPAAGMIAAGIALLVSAAVCLFVLYSGLVPLDASIQRIKQGVSLEIPVCLAQLATVPAAIIAFIAASGMKRLQMRGLAVTASLLMLVPVTPGWLITMPLGIWALIVLNRPDVKAAFGKKRNPFGIADVPDPDGADVQRFAAFAELSGSSSDANAACWVPDEMEGNPESLDGKWASRWTGGRAGKQWVTGTAVVRTVGDRVYIFYKDRSNTNLVDARRVGADRLVGRYQSPDISCDSSPWVGRIVSPERIDGQCPEGRWDFRRKLAMSGEPGVARVEPTSPQSMGESPSSRANVQPVGAAADSKAAEPLATQDESVLNNTLGLLVSVASLLLIGLWMWWAESAWPLALLFVPPIFLVVPDSRRVQLVIAVLHVVGSVGLIVWGMWLQHSAWPVVAAVSAFFGLAIGLGWRPDSDDESEPEEDTEEGDEDDDQSADKPGDQLVADSANAAIVRRQWVYRTVTLIAIAGVLGWTLGPWAMRYLFNQAKVRVDFETPGVQVALRQDDEEVVRLTQKSILAQLPPGTYEVVVTSKPSHRVEKVVMFGYDLLDYVGLTRPARIREFVPPASGTLQLERGDFASITILAHLMTPDSDTPPSTANSAAGVPPSDGSGGAEATTGSPVSPQPVKLWAADPKRDKPLVDADANTPSTAEGEGWRIDLKNPAEPPKLLRLFEVPHAIPARSTVICRAKIKTSVKARVFWGGLMLGDTYSPIDLATSGYQGEIEDWKPLEARYPAYLFAESDPPLLELNLSLSSFLVESATLWLKDIEVWYQPSPPSPPNRKPGETVVHSFTWKDQPIQTGYANEGPDGGWRFDLEKEKRLIRLFKIEDPSLARRASVLADDPGTEGCKLILRARLKTVDVGAAWLEIVYRVPDRTEFTSTKPLAGDIAERSTEWTDYSATILVMPGVRPDLIRVNLQTEGGTIRQHGYHQGGTVWIKDMELLKSEFVVPPSGGSGTGEPAEAGTPTPRSAALIDAAGAGQVSRIKQLLDEGANVNDKNAASETALMKAAAGGHSSLVKTLVLLGADPNERDKQGRTALIHAAEAGQAAVIKALYEIHAISYDELSTRPAQLKQLSGIDARLLGNVDVQVTDVAVDRFAQDNRGETALMKAMACGHLECVERLLSKVNQDVAEWFLGYGGPVHVQDVQGRTALMHAIAAGQVQSVQRMIRVSRIATGINDTSRPALDAKLLAITDHAGRTPLQLAAELGPKEITDLLRQHIEQLIQMDTRLIAGRANLQGWAPDPALYAERGRLYEMLGDRERAEADFKEAKRLEAGGTESTSAADTDAKPELKWAREVAESYLQVTGSHNADDDRVTRWLSESFKKRFEPGGTDTWVHYRFKKYVIATQQMSPTQDEGILKGTLEATERRKFERLGVAWRETSEEFQGMVRFTIRVVKDKESGRWRVDQVQFELPTEEESPPPSS